MGTTKKNEVTVKKSEPRKIQTIRQQDVLFSQEAIQLMLENRIIAQKADMNNPETFYPCLYEYFHLCMSKGFNVTNAGALASCGLSTKSFRDIMNGRTHVKDHRYKEFCQFLQACCAEYREMQMASGNLNPIVGIWWQKVYDNYTDKMNDITDSIGALGEQKSAQEIAEKYKDIIED